MFGPIITTIDVLPGGNLIQCDYYADKGISGTPLPPNLVQRLRIEGIPDLMLDDHWTFERHLDCWCVCHHLPVYPDRLRLAQGHRNRHWSLLNMEPFTYAYGALNIATDVLVFVLPIHGLLNLKISWQKTLGLCNLFLVGILVTICSIIRLQYLVSVAETTNISWDFQYFGMWSLVEANCSVVCCCMPAMAGLVQRVWSKSSEPSYGGSTAVESEKDSGGETSAKSSGRQTTDVESALKRWESNQNSRPFKHVEEQSARDLLFSRIRRGDTSSSAVLYHRKTPDRPHFVEIAHVPTTEMSTTQLTYRDHDDVLHKVCIVDRPERRPTPLITSEASITTVQRPNFIARSPHTLLPMRKTKKRCFSDASRCV